MTTPRPELVERVTIGCVRHGGHPIYECAGCQHASVIVVTSAMTRERSFRGVAGAVVRPHAPRPVEVGR